MVHGRCHWLNLYMAPVTHPDRYGESIDFWQNLFLVAVSAMLPLAKQFAFEEPLVESISGVNILTWPHVFWLPVKQLNFYTIAIEELESVTTRYKFRSMMRAPLHGFLFWFNVEFGWPAASPIITQASVIPTAPSSNPPMDGSKRKKRTNRNEAHVLSTAPEDPPTHWQHVSKSETLNVEEGSAVDDASYIRHLNLISCGDVESKFQAVDARKLRTVFSMVDVFDRPRKFKSLRTLKLQKSGIAELPDSICKQIHLRYLDVSRSNIKAFPESITKLYHLETLRFTYCRSLKKLPKKMRNLVSLRHLHFNDPELVPAEVRFLTRLQTLSFFVVGPDHMVEELGCLNELKGELKIHNLEQVRDKEEAGKAKLREKRMDRLA
ncbi:disease resistance protein [Salix suchowensis]|nr:disease resistance protein [Salix suchowensis]